MSVKLNVTSCRRSDLPWLDPKEILVYEENRGRTYPPTPEQVMERAVSILTDGQLQPVECRRDNEARPVLTLGFTRTAAARLIQDGFEYDGVVYFPDPEFKIQAKIVDANEEVAFRHNVAENNDRNDTSDIDDAHNQNRFRERYGWSDADITKFYKYKNTTKVGRLRKLLQHDRATQLLIHEGKLSTDAAITLLDLPESERAAAIQACLNESGKVNGTAVAAQVRQHHLSDLPSEAEVGTVVVEVSGAEPTPPVQDTNGKKSVGMKPSEIRKFWAKIAEESKQPAVKRFAKDYLAFVAGKTTEVGMKNALGRILDAKRENE